MRAVLGKGRIRSNKGTTEHAARYRHGRRKRSDIQDTGRYRSRSPGRHISRPLTPLMLRRYVHVPRTATRASAMAVRILARAGPDVAHLWAGWDE